MICPPECSGNNVRARNVLVRRISLRETRATCAFIWAADVVATASEAAPADELAA